MAVRKKLTVELPEVFIPLVGVSEQVLPAEIEKLVALDLVRRGLLPYTQAAELLEISQAEFITYLGTNQVSIFRFAPNELEGEMEQ